MDSDSRTEQGLARSDDRSRNPAVQHRKSAIQSSFLHRLSMAGCLVLLSFSASAQELSTTDGEYVTAIGVAREITFNLVELGLVTGGVAGRRQVSSIELSDPNDRWDPDRPMSSFVTASVIGQVCIELIIVGAIGENFNPGDQFQVDYAVTDSQGTASGFVRFDQGTGPAPAAPVDGCNDPETDPEEPVPQPEGPDLDTEAFTRNNPTLRAVASAIDFVCPELQDLKSEQESLPADQELLLNRCGALKFLAESDGNADLVFNALQQIAGEEILSQGTTTVQVANLQTSNIASRIAALRAGASGVSLAGLSFHVDGATLPPQIMAAAMPDQLMGGGSSGEDSSTWSHLGFFLNGRWNFGDKKETDLEAAFDFDTYGITGGLDYRFTPNFVLGAAVGYSDTRAKFSEDSGRVDSDSLNLTLFGTWYSGPLYVDFAAGKGDFDFDAQRVLVFQDGFQGGVNTEATGSTNGDQITLFVSTGYNFATGPWTLGPYLSLDYLKVDIDAFEESGGQGWALAYEKQDIKSRVATGGLRVSYALSTSWGVVVPHLRADFKKEFEDDARSVTARFVADPFGTPMVFQSDAPDSSFSTVGGGLSFVTRAGFSGFVDYEVLTGYDNLNANTLTAGIRFQHVFR